MRLSLFGYVRETVVRRLSSLGIHGQIDGISAGALRGWAFSVHEPRRRLAILAETGPSIFTSYRADLHRADVQHVTPASDGYCGFSIPMAKFRWPGPYRILDASTRRQLSGSPYGTAERQVKRRMRELGPLSFALDRTAGRLSGWLEAKGEPFGRRDILLELDGRIVLNAKACLYLSDGEDREDDPALRGDSFHGFSLPLHATGRHVRLIDRQTGIVFFDLRR